MNFAFKYIVRHQINRKVLPRRRHSLHVIFTGWIRNDFLASDFCSSTDKWYQMLYSGWCTKDKEIMAPRWLKCRAWYCTPPWWIYPDWCHAHSPVCKSNRSFQQLPAQTSRRQWCSRCSKLKYDINGNRVSRLRLGPYWLLSLSHESYVFIS